ncbi:tripartite tricarboxylate transporter TctB family protein [Ferrovibrio sp.]|uniref:tripartite tricarboxylate transporter TctB family protein n=2 Tax=Ferrovibrio sp. TaxID=1917215 RepID=UPI0035179439
MTRDACAGLFVACFGAGILALTWSYPSGNPSEIGPGLVMQAGGGAMLLLGLLQAGLARRRQSLSAAPDGRVPPAAQEARVPPAAQEARVPDAPLPAFRSWRPFVIPASMALFALLLQAGGLALTAAVATFTATYGLRSLTLRSRILCAIGLSAFVTLLFGYGLRIQMPIWPGLFMP